MTQTNWYGAIEEDGEALGWEFAGDRVVRDLDGAALASLQAPVLAFGGGADDTVPAALAPTAAPGGDLIQTAPQGRLPAALRLALLGLCQQIKDFDGVACVIGRDHSHWVRISAEEAVSFHSFLTPGLARALLQPSVQAPTQAMPQEADATALADTLSRPERLASHLSSAVLAGDEAALLGHLIGAELAATRPYWLGQRVVVIAEGALQPAYISAMTPQGIMAEQAGLRALQHRGLRVLHQPR